jgi:methyl halide transferase
MNKDYWTNRYTQNQVGWDIGFPSTPIKTYVDQLQDNSINILIPGAGNAYEAEHLWERGFKNVTVLDVSAVPLENLKTRVPEFPDEQLVEDDFFNHEGQYDLIIEQTFFCALPVDLRKNYVTKMHSLLNSSGKIMGLLFDFPLTEKGPPFGGEKTEYYSLFSELFVINKLERCYNSIAPRAGNELFFILSKTR